MSKLKSGPYVYDNSDTIGKNTAQALYAIANELKRKNDIEFIEKIQFSENDDKYHAYKATWED